MMLNDAYMYRKFTRNNTNVCSVLDKSRYPKLSVLGFLDASKDLVSQHLAKFFIEIQKSPCRPSDRGQSDNLYTTDSGIQHS